MKFIKLNNGQYGEFVIQNKYLKENGVWIPAYGDYWRGGVWKDCDAECESPGTEYRDPIYYRVLRNGEKLFMSNVFASGEPDINLTRPCMGGPCFTVDAGDCSRVGCRRCSVSGCEYATHSIVTQHTGHGSGTRKVAEHIFTKPIKSDFVYWYLPYRSRDINDYIWARATTSVVTNQLIEIICMGGPKRHTRQRRNTYMWYIRHGDGGRDDDHLIAKIPRGYIGEDGKLDLLFSWRRQDYSGPYFWHHNKGRKSLICYS